MMGNPYDLSEGPKGARGLRRPNCDDEQHATLGFYAEREWSYRARAEKAEEERDAALIELERVQAERDALREALLLIEPSGDFSGWEDADGNDISSRLQIALDYPRQAAKRHSPKVVCLCGSTRFGDAFRKANFEETMKGRIVLSIGCTMRSDQELFGHLSERQLKEIKWQLDWLHLRKIDLADEILVLNVDGYVGESTAREIQYARNSGKPIRWLEEPPDREAV